MIASCLKLNWILISILILVSPIAAWAVVETGTGSNLSATVTPTDPRAGEMVTIVLTGYGFDLNQSYIRWFKDGKEVRSGFSQKSYSFRLGQLGQQTQINVFVSQNSRLLAEKSFLFEPADLVLDWQAESFVPPLYQGKARASAGAKIKLAAEAHLVNDAGNSIEAARLIYRWTRDGATLESASGVGKNTLTIETEATDTQTKIGLEVSSVDNRKHVSGNLILNLEKPRLVFYEQKPLSGVNYRHQISDPYELYATEAVFQSFPLFWPLKTWSRLNYSWQVNRTAVSDRTGDPSSLVVRPSTGATGQSEISLRVAGPSATEVTTGRFKVNFGGN